MTSIEEVINMIVIESVEVVESLRLKVSKMNE